MEGGGGGVCVCLCLRVINRIDMTFIMIRFCMSFYTYFSHVHYYSSTVILNIFYMSILTLH